MLAVVAAAGARFDAGSVALAMARRWSASGESVLFVDADAAGARLAERLGEAEHAEYSPAVRGLPSLMVARQPLTLGLLANHCYSLDTVVGSLWALFAPHHPDGAEQAARWLGGRADELAAVGAQRSVVVSSSLPAAAELLAPVLCAATVLVVVAPVGTVEAAKELWEMCRDLRLSGRRCRHRVIIVEGDPVLSDDEIGIEAGMHVAGRLPLVSADRVLRLCGGRRERAFTASIDRIAARVLAFSRLVAAGSGDAEAVQTSSRIDTSLAFSQPGVTVNGDHRGRPFPAPEARGEESLCEGSG